MLTDLKVSSWHLKFVVYTPEHNAKMGSHGIEF